MNFHTDHIPEIDTFKTVESMVHDCKRYLELRERVVGKGTSYVNQCLFCGRQTGTALSKKKFTVSPPPFDDNRSLDFEEHRTRFTNEALQQYQHTGAHSGPTETYQPIDPTGDISDFLNEQVEKTGSQKVQNAIQRLLVRQREGIVSQYNPIYSTEDELHDWFKGYFSQWFHINHEVNGQGYLDREQRNVRIDFVIKPKPSLIELGVKDGYLGVEVKYIDPRSGKGFHGKASRTIFQALSYWYSGARWVLKDKAGPVQLDSVLVLTNLSFDTESAQVFETYDQHYEKVWRSLFSLANHGNVGEIKLNNKSGNIQKWGFYYNGANYLSWTHKSGIILGNQHLVSKHRIGSSK